MWKALDRTMLTFELLINTEIDAGTRTVLASFDNKIPVTMGIFKSDNEYLRIKQNYLCRFISRKHFLKHLYIKSIIS